MTYEEVHTVVEALRAEGIKPTVAKVRARLKETRGAGGSDRDIAAHLRAMREDLGEEEADDDDAGDVVALAETAVAQAQRRLQALEDAVPLAHEAVAQALSALLNASGRELTVLHSVRCGWLPEAHPRVGEAQASHRAARREVYLAREHAELVERRAALQAEAPEETDDPGVNYRRKAVWKQAVQSVQAEIDATLAKAGL
jgi:Plasmid replication region DNA-binding N-term